MKKGGKNMTTISTRSRLNLQLAVATILVLAGLVLIFAGFYVPPLGEIHNSVLIAFGELLTFAGSLFGIDYRYKYKSYIEMQHPRPAHGPQACDEPVILVDEENESNN